MKPTTPPPADRFRIGDVWRSPRGKDWRVQRIDHLRLALLVCEVSNRRTTQKRHVLATGTDMTNAWVRISWGGEQ